MFKFISKDKIDESAFAQHIRHEADNVIDLDKLSENGENSDLKGQRKTPRRQMLLR